MTDRPREGDGPLGFEPDGEDAREEHAREEPPPAPPPRQAVPRAAGASRYGWFLGVALFLIIVVAIVNGINSDGPGARGLERGERLVPFAAPLALSDVECDGRPCDANVATRAGADSQEGSTPACDVRGPEVLNVCELAERGPVVLAFLATRGGDCLDTLDLVDRARERFPDVQFAAVAIAGDRDDARDAIRSRGWKLPVAFDRDGAVANRYGVSVCPQITFAAQGGRVVSTSFGELGPAELGRRIRAAIAAS